MSNKKISQLQNVTASGVTPYDLLAIVNYDVYSGTTKNIRIPDLKSYINSGNTDTYVTGYTYQDNTFTISDSSGNTFSTTIDTVTGLTVNGMLSATTLTVISGASFSQIPVSTTGNTLSVDENGFLVIATGETKSGTVAAEDVKATYIESVETRSQIISAQTINTYSFSAQTASLSRIKSFSPLNINDGDEGSVYFGSTSGVTVDVLNSRIGIGTQTPTKELDIIGDTQISGSLSATTISGTTLYGDGSNLTGIELPYKVYAALLTQTGTADPVVTIVENTLGTVTINRDSNGRYSVNSSSLFTSNKTIVYINTITSQAGPYGGYSSITAGSSSVFWIDTTKVIGSGGLIPGTGTDNVLYNTSFEIKVYN
jgi:hypothetical protein